jgi:gamma-glutamylaminecyclotransferase
MSVAPTRVFVYGTLLVGEENHRFLERARSIGRARTEPRFRLLDLGPYPAMLPGGEIGVHGEVYEVDRETLERLDALEDHPHLYRRTAIPLDDGTLAEAYLLTREPGEGELPIASGDFRSRFADRASFCEKGRGERSGCRPKRAK